MTAPPFDVTRARRETRGCRELIHFNNAGAALMPAPVCDVLHSYLRQEELQGGYEVMDKQAAALENFYLAVAKLINCDREEVAFVDSASRGWAAAFYAFDFQPGDRILTSGAEYGSNLVAMLHRVKKCGVEIDVIPDDEDGQIDLDALQQRIDGRVKLIALTHIPSGNGLINPAAAVGRIANAVAIPFLLDACQSLGQLPLDVAKLGCDLLCGTGRKFLRGPRGTGLLYVRRRLLERLEPAQLNQHAANLHGTEDYHLREDARRYEFWERSYAGQVALGVAIDYALGWALDAIANRVQDLATGLRSALADVPNITVTDVGVEKSAIVTFSVAGQAATALQRGLAAAGINLSLVPASANPCLFRGQAPTNQLRASLHYYNTEVEIETFCAVLRRLLA